MPNRMMQVLSNIGQRALEKSRGYYFRPSMTFRGGAEMLSEAEYAEMLQEIDKFSAQFTKPIAKTKPVFLKARRSSLVRFQR